MRVGNRDTAGSHDGCVRHPAIDGAAAETYDQERCPFFANEAEMRWPLRFQILLPLAVVIVATVGLVSGLSAYLAASRTERQIQQQFRDIADTLSHANFPLTGPVLQQMRGLVGADFVLIDSEGRIRASSRPSGDLAAIPRDWSEQRGNLSLTTPVRLPDGRYFHGAVRLGTRIRADRGSVLHVLYPERDYREAVWSSVYPPLAVGAGALAFMGLVAVALAARLSRPLARLQNHVARIARGEFTPLPQPNRDDEVSDLVRSINRMAELLSEYDSEVRRTERMRTLGRLGGGIAHHLRNSATGCRMAIDLHRRDCPTRGGETLEVAERQLLLMEKYLQRFLSLGKQGASRRDPVDLCGIVKDMVSLVRPSATHGGIALEGQLPDAPLIVTGDAERLEQLIVNLLLNAIEAAASRDSDRPALVTPRVTVCVARTDDDQVTLCVEDTGTGPDAEMVRHLFEPFATNKPAGVGIGLCVAREIATEHGGEIEWRRREAITCFSVRLPLARNGASSCQDC